MNDNDFIRDFKGIWIPAEIWLDSRLNALDKIILVEIDSLDSNEEGCFASNKYLAEFCQCTETKISTSINKLVKLEYLKIAKFDGRKRYIKSRIKKIERQPLKNLNAEFNNFKDINIINNNKNNNKYNIYGELQNVKLTDEEYLKIKERNLLPYIEKLSSYIASKGKKYKSHYATILTWARGKETTMITPKWFNEEITDEQISLEEQNELENILKEMGE